MTDKLYQGSVRANGTARQLTDFPVATYSLIALNLLLFFGSLPGDPGDLAARHGVIPDHLRFLPLFTSAFLHFDTLHLIVNMAFLWLFGRRVERAIGPVEFLLFYIGSGFAGSLLHVGMVSAFEHNLLAKPLVGASGAVSGVLGMYAVRFGSQRVAVGRGNASAISLLLAWLVLQVALGILGLTNASVGPFDLRYVGYWSHIGGFIFGMAAASAIAVYERKARMVSERRLGELRRRALTEVARSYEGLAGALPDDPFAYAELGRVSALLGQQGQSTANYLRAIELYRKGGQRDAALAKLWEALEFWPEEKLPPDVLFRFACDFEVLGEYAEAANRFGWLAYSSGDTPEREMALLKLGQVELDRLQSPARAVEALEQLIKDYPASRWAQLAAQLLDRARS